MANLSKDLKEFRNNIEELYNSGSMGDSLNRAISDCYDSAIRSVSCPEKSIAVVALGGYGRREMAPYSDVDLLVLHSNTNISELEDFSKKIIYTFWDGNIEASAVVRTIKECVAAGRKDNRSLSSLVDARFIAGDNELFKRLIKKIESEISGFWKRRRFIGRKIEENRRRLSKYGHSVFLSEPHVKEGEGGLRCYHSAMWIARSFYGAKILSELVELGIIDERSAVEWNEAIDFLWKVRNGLHILARRRQDRLTYEYQEQLALLLGYKEETKRAFIESFLRDFYKSASHVYHASERLIGTVRESSLTGRTINFLSSKSVDNDISIQKNKIHLSGKRLLNSPEIAFKAWKLSSENGMQFDEKAMQSVSSAAYSWKVPLTEQSKIQKYFRDTLCNINHLDRVLLEMHESGALFKLIPEFNNIRFLVNYDAYHLYTVDIHSILLLRELAKLCAVNGSNIFSRVLNDINRKDILALAALLHDIGKGNSSGAKHEKCGAELVSEIMKRFGYENADISVVEFLVKSHLILPRLAFSRDLDDSRMTENLAQTVGSIDNLNMLFVLTYADICATNPEIWSGWKNELLTKLYHKTLDTLEGRGLTNEAIENAIRQKMSNILLDGPVDDSENMRLWLHQMPSRFVMNTDAHLIRKFYNHLKTSEKPLIEIHREIGGSAHYHNLDIVTRDAPGLFLKICSALSANKASILEAQLHTGANGDIVDNFRIKYDGNFSVLLIDLQNALCGIDYFFENPVHAVESRSHTALRKSRSGYETKVIVDNDVSADYTVVEIHAEDKLGLLYKIAKWFYKNGYDINMAKVTTHVGQAIDTFYIRDIKTGKIENKEKIAEIEKGILGET